MQNDDLTLLGLLQAASWVQVTSLTSSAGRMALGSVSGYCIILPILKPSSTIVIKQGRQVSLFSYAQKALPSWEDWWEDWWEEIFF
jgi:hypothetical protein